MRRISSAALALALAACVGPPVPKDMTGPGPSGNLSVAVSGLPPGVTGRVIVDGPFGYRQTLSASADLLGLLVGSYRVTADFVNADSMTWTAQPTPDSVFIDAGQTASVAVSYTGGPITSLNLRVTGVQLFQSTQRADGSVPMVANRDALLRVFVTADGANAVQPVVRVRLFNGSSVVDSLDVSAPAAAVPQTVDTSALGTTWNALIPAARVVPGMAFQVVLDPGNAIPETNEADNRWPSASGHQAVAVLAVPPLNIRFVPVRQSVNGLTGNVSAANQDALAETTRRIFPLSTVNVTTRALYTTHAPALDPNDTSGAWAQILSETSALQAADGSTDDYVSIVSTSYGSGIAGLGWVGAPAAVAWDKPGSVAGVVAHELGHNFGRMHAPCGSPSNVDPSYPYSGAFIGTWGIDVTAASLKSPTSIRDLMSYCHPEWISDYTYMGVLTFRGSAPARTPGPAAPGLVVWGRISAGRVILEPGFLVTAPARLPARSGPHRLDGLNATGQRVFTLTFDGEVAMDLPAGDEQQFAFVVPLSQAELAQLASLRLTANGLTAIQVPSAALQFPPDTMSATAARVGDELEVHWDRAYPMAILRDVHTGEIVSLGRAGVARVPAAPDGVLVELSQGVTSLPAITVGRP
jgi:hypothetical protein